MNPRLDLWKRTVPATAPPGVAPSPAPAIPLPGEVLEEEVLSVSAETYVHDAPSSSPDPAVNPRRRRKPEKYRNRLISVTLSSEEERIIRDHVAKLDLGISEWMRGLAFKAMGKKVPSRK